MPRIMDIEPEFGVIGPLLNGQAL